MCDPVEKAAAARAVREVETARADEDLRAARALSREPSQHAQRRSPRGGAKGLQQDLGAGRFVKSCGLQQILWRRRRLSKHRMHLLVLSTECIGKNTPQGSLVSTISTSKPHFLRDLEARMLQEGQGEAHVPWRLKQRRHGREDSVAQRLLSPARHELCALGRPHQGELYNTTTPNVCTYWVYRFQQQDPGGTSLEFNCI